MSKISPIACGNRACIYRVPDHCSSDSADEILRLTRTTGSSPPGQNIIDQYDQHQVDPDETFSIYKEKECLVDPQRYNPKDLSPNGKVYRNGGVPLTKIKEWTPHRLAQFTNILYGIHRMRTMGFNHGDIHEDNIVYDGQDFRIIDLEPRKIKANGMIDGDTAYVQFTHDPEALEYLFHGHPYGGDGPGFMGVVTDGVNHWLFNELKRKKLTLNTWISLIDKYYPQESKYLDRYRIGNSGNSWPKPVAAH